MGAPGLIVRWSQCWANVSGFCKAQTSNGTCRFWGQGVWGPVPIGKFEHYSPTSLPRQVTMSLEQVDVDEIRG